MDNLIKLEKENRENFNGIDLRDMFENNVSNL